jgi:hypothetical protein
MMLNIGLPMIVVPKRERGEADLIQENNSIFLWNVKCMLGL